MPTSLVRSILTKKIVKRSLWVAAFTCYVFSVVLFLRFITKPVQMEMPVGTPVAQKSTQAPPQFGAPVKLFIPRLKIGAAIVAVGVTSDGAMDIPKNPNGTAWYSYGPRPGNIGSAVIAGHYGWDNGRGSIFNNLHKLRPGDEVTVYDERGAAAVFIVRKTKRYDPAADAVKVFKSSDGKPHLNLVTCEGSWSGEKQTYSSRLVVFTDRKS